MRGGARSGRVVGGRYLGAGSWGRGGGQRKCESIGYWMSWPGQWRAWGWIGHHGPTERARTRERAMRWGDGGVEKKKGVRRISIARQRHVWISLPSLQSLTLQQRRSGSNLGGRKSARWSSPEKSTLMHEKLLWLLTFFARSLFNRMHLFVFWLFFFVMYLCLQANTIKATYGGDRK